MEPLKSEIVSQNIKINVNNLSEVSKETIDNAKLGIEMVWKKYVGESMEMDLEFCDYLVDDQGKIINSAGVFDTKTGKIAIAVKSSSFKSFTTNNFPQSAAALMIAAHETSHKAQAFFGHKLNDTTDFDSDEYKDDPNEKEAWFIALNVVKKVFPNASGNFEYSGRVYKIPEQSIF